MRPSKNEYCSAVTKTIAQSRPGPGSLPRRTRVEDSRSGRTPPLMLTNQEMKVGSSLASAVMLTEANPVFRDSRRLRVCGRSTRDKFFPAEESPTDYLLKIINEVIQITSVDDEEE